MRELSERRLLAALAVVLIFAAAAVDRFSGQSVIGLSDVLLNVAVALAAWAGGWGAGILALGAFPIALSLLGSSLSFSRSLGEWIECAVILVVVVLARRAIERFRRSEKKLRALLSSMTDVILVLDGAGKYVEVVPTNPGLLYRPLSELVGRRIGDVFPAEQTEFFLKHISTALNECRTVNVDYSLDINGATIWFSASVSPMNDSLVLWVARDITARQEAEEAVRHAKSNLEERVDQRTRQLSVAEARYRSIFEQANDVIFTLTRDRRLTSLNPAFARVTGYSAADWLGRDFVDLIAPDLQPLAAAKFADALMTGSLDLTVATICGADGRRVVLEVSLVPQTINDENVGFLGFARDVTARERVGAERRRNEEQLAESQRIAKLGSWEVDMETERMWWSDQNYALFGFERSDRQLMSPDFLQLVVPDDRPRIDEINAELLAHGSHEWELRIRTAGGVEKTIGCHGRLLKDERGNRRIFGTSQDITEKKRAERLLRDSEERFRLLARATSDAIWDLDYATGNVWRGEGYETLFGYAAGTLEPNVECFRELVHPDDRQQLSASFQKAIESGQLSFTHEFRFRRADGSYADILDRGYIVRDRQKVPVRVLGAMMDVTERKQMTERIEQAKRLSSLGRLSASIAHEFNNVLMGVQANAEVMGRRAPAELQQVVDNVTGAVRRGRRITEEILRYMRPADPATKSLNVRAFLEQWSSEIQPALRERLSLDIDVSDPDLYIRADPQQIAQVFTNLAFNSRDAMSEGGGTLSIQAGLSGSFSTFGFGVVRTPDRFVHFRLTDDGAGIGADQLARIFEPLYSTKREGTGLGLAVSYQIVTRHDGHIFVESTVGTGTTFHVFLPVCGAAAETAAKSAASRALSLGRVLLVEDEPEVAAGVAMLLEAEGADVQVVHTGGETIPAIERFDPGVVILDIGLPDIDGIAVYERVAQRWPGLRVLFSSGHAQARNLERWLTRPNVALLVKPYEMAELREALTRLLEVATA